MLGIASRAAFLATTSATRSDRAVVSIGVVMTAQIAVIGAGLWVMASRRFLPPRATRFRFHDPNAKILASAKERIAAIFALLRARPRRWRRHHATSAAFATAVRDADFVFEAGPEKLEVKRAIFKHLGEKTKPGAILCTNTSAIPSIEIGRVA